MSHLCRDRVLASFLVATSLLHAACGATTLSPSSAASPAPTLSPPAQSTPLPSPSPSESSISATPSASTTSFAFAVEDVVAYYERQRFACSGQQASAAVGFAVRMCEMTDEAGRTRVVGLVTDPDGGLANGFASVKGTDAETILVPMDAMDPLAAFLGVMLGREQRVALLPWLTSHLGDVYAETASGLIKVTTYTESEGDHSKLYVEVANPVYLDAQPVGAP